MAPYPTLERFAVHGQLSEADVVSIDDWKPADLAVRRLRRGALDLRADARGCD
jgi:hypothetical protein